MASRFAISGRACRRWRTCSRKPSEKREPVGPEPRTTNRDLANGDLRSDANTRPELSAIRWREDGTRPRLDRDRTGRHHDHDQEEGLPGTADVRVDALRGPCSSDLCHDELSPDRDV